jgi:hypothetical protein
MTWSPVHGSTVASLRQLPRRVQRARLLRAGRASSWSAWGRHGRGRAPVRYFTAADLVDSLYRILADNSVGRGDRGPCSAPTYSWSTSSASPWRTPALNYSSGSSPPPTNTDPTATARTGLGPLPARRPREVHSRPPARPPKACAKPRAGRDRVRNQDAASIHPGCSRRRGAQHRTDRRSRWQGPAPALDRPSPFGAALLVLAYGPAGAASSSGGAVGSAPGRSRLWCLQRPG